MALAIYIFKCLGPRHKTDHAFSSIKFILSAASELLAEQRAWSCCKAATVWSEPATLHTENPMGCSDKGQALSYALPTCIRISLCTATYTWFWRQHLFFQYGKFVFPYPQKRFSVGGCLETKLLPTLRLLHIHVSYEIVLYYLPFKFFFISHKLHTVILSLQHFT